MINYYLFHSRNNEMRLSTLNRIINSRKNNEYVIIEIQGKFGEPLEMILQRIDIRVREIANEIRIKRS